MNRIVSLTLIGCFLLSSFYEWGYEWWNDLESLPEFGIFFGFTFSLWDGYDLSKLVIIVALAFSLYMMIPFTQMLYKSISVWFITDSIWNVGQWFLSGEYQEFAAIFNFALLTPWMLWAVFRDYEPVSDDINPTKVYWIASRPRRHTSFLISLWGKPYGGSSLLINNKVYGFHKGKFEEREFTDRLTIVAKESDLKITQGLTSLLSSMEGSRWKSWNNCLTLRLRTLRCQKK